MKHSAEQKELKGKDAENSQAATRLYSHRMSKADHARAWAAQLVYSPTARYYYWFMCVLTIFEMGVTFIAPMQAPETRWFMCLELFMVAMIMNEVVLRLIADGPMVFLRSRSSLFDLGVAAVCLWVAVFLMAAPSLLHRVQKWVPVTILRVRDSLRLLRLVFLIKNSRKAHHLGMSIMHLRIDEHDLEGGHSANFPDIDSPGSNAMDHLDIGVAFKNEQGPGLSLSPMQSPNNSHQPVPVMPLSPLIATISPTNSAGTPPMVNVAL